ncbi:ubinuclein-2b isoform X1 [Esox lucius]|uniref:Ubinuclein 2b n=1 Tax=Esox lucius TaxID=8010 RepID=A0A3P8Y2N9_ESOLU|nr:ubinuclein-2b isoform X1 [Esox lucius]
MAEPRKVPFVTISSFNNNNASPSESKKRRREDEAEISLGEDGGGGSVATGPGSGTGASPFGNVNLEAGDGDSAETRRLTVRLNLSLSEPSERGSAEFNYSELVQSTHVIKPPPPAPAQPKGLTPALDRNDPFGDDKERREVEALAKKFENKYGNIGKKKRKDRIQDLIDIGFGYDETDPFIDNSEAYDELVPASLTTKLGGFYINTGTLQFRAASESEGEDFKKLKDGEDRAIKKRRKKQDGLNMDEKKPRKNKMPKQGVSGLNVHRPEKKKRKKLMKDSLNLAAMLRRFTREKEESRKKNPSLPRGQANANSGLLNAHPKPTDIHMADLTSDPAMMSLLGAANNNDMLQDMMGDLDFGLLDSPQPSSPAQGENGALGRVQTRVPGPQGGLLPPPPLPNGLPGPLSKRIEDLRTASRQFDQEGRKKFFTLDMNNILLDIELQVQEQPAAVRSSVYSHLEAFVPCNKEALLKRLKKLSLNIQDDRLRAPLLKLKLAVCSVMPEQIARYNMDCIAKVAKQQSEEGEKNGSEEEDEEKPGKRVMGPRKKFVWDEKLRTLLCNLVRVKLGCYELEGQSSLSPEDYLKTFMETEVKPLWPKGWMQARMLFKESLVAHGHLTGNPAKKKNCVPTPKTKPKEGVWVQRSTPPGAVTPSSVAPATRRPMQSPAEPICLLDSLDDELTAPSLDSISQALALLSNAAKGLVHGDSPPSPDGPKNVPSALHSSPLLQQHKKSAVSVVSAPLYVSTSSPALSRPSAVSSPLSSARSEGLGSMKAGGAQAQAHRQSVLSTPRPAVTGLSKAGTPCSPSQPKPRPPPTASPLAPPNQKGFGTNNTKADGGDSPHPLPHAPRGAQPSQSKASPLSSPFSHSLPGAPTQPQSNFITPMQATLTKSSHSSTSPIIKLTPRPPNPSTTTSSASPNARPQAASTMHQYSSKSPAGFRPPFSGAQGGPAKHGQGSYSPAGGPKTPSQIINSSANTSLTNTSSISKHSGSSPAMSTAMNSQRQRPTGGTTQGAKPLTSVSTSSVSSQLPQVSSAGSNLLGSAQALPLGFGMLGGLVPVSLPFQFPSLLNLPPLVGTAGSNTGTSGSSVSSSAEFALTQNLLKSLQSGSQVALPPHLQLAFSELYSSGPDVSQNQGGDVKRKSL